MSKKTTRVLSMVLAIALVVTMMAGVMTAGAKTYKDIYNGHWAQQYIAYLSDKGVFEGNPDGTFAPDKAITTAEMMAVINRTFGLYSKSSIYYSDVKSADWFYGDVQKAAAQGYIIAEGYYVYPNQGLTREKAVAMIAKYLGLEPAANSTRYFADASSINSAYVGYVNAAVNAGIIDGYIENGGFYFKPKQALQRDEVAKIIHTMLSGNIITSSVTGINAKGGCVTQSYVTVANSYFSGTVYVTEGAVNGTTFSNSVIDTLVIRGNGYVSLKDTRVRELIIDASSGTASVIASGSSSIQTTTVKSGASLTDSSTEGGLFTNVAAAMGNSETLNLNGIFPNVYVTTPYTNIALADDDTVVTKLTVNNTAANTKVTGKGVITNIVVNASGVTTQQLPINYSIAKNLYATFAGIKYEGTGTTVGTSSGFVVGYPSVSASYSSSTGKTSVSVSVKAVAGGKVYVVAYPASYTAPTTSTIISNASSNSAYVGTVVDVTANTAKTISLTVNNTAYGADYRVAAIFVPTNGTSSSYSPVYAKVNTSYTTYMTVGSGTNLDTYFVSNPQISAYTAPTSSSNGSLSVDFTTGIPGTVYLYAYNANTTTPSDATVKAYGTAVSVTYKSSTGYYTATGTVTLNRGTTYNAVAAVFVPNYSTYPMTMVRSTSLAKSNYLYPVTTTPTTAIANIYLTGRTAAADAKMTINVNANVAGYLYYAIVPVADTPNVDTIKASTKSDAIRVYPSQIGTVVSKEITYMSAYDSSAYKVAAVFVPDSASYKSVYYYCVLGNTTNNFYPYTPSSVTLTIKDAGGNDVVAADEALVLTFNQKMYYKNGVNYTALSNALSNLKTLFAVSSATGTFSDYTVNVTTLTNGATQVTLKPTTGKSWPDGADLTVSTAVTNAEGNYPVSTQRYVADFYKIVNTKAPNVKVDGTKVTEADQIFYVLPNGKAMVEITFEAGQVVRVNGVNQATTATQTKLEKEYAKGTYTVDCGAPANAVSFKIVEAENLKVIVDEAKKDVWTSADVFTWEAHEDAKTYAVTLLDANGNMLDYEADNITAPVERNISVNHLSKGIVTIKVDGFDANGNLVATGKATVTAKNYGTLTVLSPTDGLLYADTAITFDHLNKPTDVTIYYKVVSSQKGVTVSGLTAGTEEGKENQRTFTVSGAEDTVTLTINATAGADGPVVATTSITLKVKDGSNPTLKVENDLAEDVTKWSANNKFTVTFGAGYTVKVTQGNATPLVLSTSGDVYLTGDGVPSASPGTLNMDKKYNVTFTLFKGNESITSETVVVDTTMPTVTITVSNKDKVITSDTVTISVNGEIPAGYKLFYRSDAGSLWENAFADGSKSVTNYINFTDKTLRYSSTKANILAETEKTVNITAWIAANGSDTVKYKETSETAKNVILPELIFSTLSVTATNTEIKIGTKDNVAIPAGYKLMIEPYGGKAIEITTSTKVGLNFADGSVNTTGTHTAGQKNAKKSVSVYLLDAAGNKAALKTGTISSTLVSPVTVSISGGKISFSHPDSESYQWTWDKGTTRTKEWWGLESISKTYTIKELGGLKAGDQITVWARVAANENTVGYLTYTVTAADLA